MKKSKLLLVVLITVFLSSYASAEDWWDVKAPGRESAEPAHPVQDWWKDAKVPEKPAETTPPVQEKRTVAVSRKTAEPKHPIQDWWKDAKAPEPAKKPTEPKPPVQQNFVMKKPVETPNPILVWWGLITLGEEIDLRKDFNAALTRSANNQYVLSYKDGELSATTVQGILDEMRRNNFYPTSINTVRDNAYLIPADLVSEKELSEIKQDINDFFLNPTQATFDALAGKYRTYNRSGDSSGKAVAESIYQTIYAFSPDLAARLGGASR
jgi:hypothetical protein